MGHRTRVTVVLALLLFGSFSAGLSAPDETGARDGTVSSPSSEQYPLRLPPDLIFDQGASSIGQVVFRHTTHVAFVNGDCIACHVRLFSLLHPTHQASHEEMSAGRSCGGCHDGEHAFGAADGEECFSCHTAGVDAGPAGSASRSPSRISPSHGLVLREGAFSSPVARGIVVSPFAKGAPRRLRVGMN